MFTENIYARPRFEPNAIIIEFSSAEKGHVKEIDIDIILDFDFNNEVLDIEIINLKHHAGNEALEGFCSSVINGSKKMTFSYDETVDAFYLSLSAERSISQRAVPGILFLDDEGHIIRIKALIT